MILDRINKNNRFRLTLIAGFFVFAIAFADSSSSSFRLENPSFSDGGGESSSASFRYISSLGQLVIGGSSSASFEQNAGFLYFPSATAPAISAAAGNGQVALAWTAASPYFASVTEYQFGVATSAIGAFTFSSAGTALTAIQTGLTNGTTYYFKVRAYSDDVLLSESVIVSATPVGTATLPSGGGGGASSGGSEVSLSGRAYPLSTVRILKDGQPAVTTIAGPDAVFRATVRGLSSGSYAFSVYSEDATGKQSTLFTFPITLSSTGSAQIGGIFLAPTIGVDKSVVKKGDVLSIFGQSAPLAMVTISVHSAEEIFRQVPTDENGVYLYNFSTVPLEMGKHQTKSRADLNNEITQYGKILSFEVGMENVPVEAQNKQISKADLNDDGRVNIVDFSIAAFWYKRSGFPAKIDLNGDRKIDLVDFSILAYNWTG